MKPRIITPSPDDADIFTFWSDGWYEIKIRHTSEAQSLMKKARECVDAGQNVLDVIQRLESAGFDVVRSDCCPSDDPMDV